MPTRTSRVAGVVLVSAAILALGSRAETRQEGLQDPNAQRLASGITAAGLRAHVESLASDALEGRDTPSRGLDMAADYIADVLRSCGLEPGADASYFQTAAFETVTQPIEGLSLSIDADGQVLSIPTTNLVHLATARADLSGAGLYLVDLDGVSTTAIEDTRGKILVLDLADVQAWTPEQRAARGGLIKDPQSALAGLHGAALVFNRSKKDSFGGPQLREVSGTPAPGGPPIVSVNDEGFRRLVATWKPGPVAASATLSVPAPVIVPAGLKNVAGIMRGSDPALRDTYLIVSAHYDHLGTRQSANGPAVFNGANDDASGVAAVLGIAQAMVRGGLRPRRSILFLAFFGEEKSGLGSQYYVKHPLVPLAKTVADLNLEQLGRTDDADGAHMAEAAVTGFDYSDVGEIVARAGESVGVAVNGRDSSKYFTKADNVFLARAGIPSHTVSVTYEFPGRHTPEDDAARLDYANMDLVTRAVALTVWTLSTSDQAPRWRSANPEAQPYAEAWQRLTAAK